ncbi:hypothetical protein [Variovorax sp. LT1R16]
MKPRKTWHDRLASYPHLPNVKEIPTAMRARHGEGTIATNFAKKLTGTH